MVFLFPEKKLKKMLESAEPGFKFSTESGANKKYKAEVDKEGTKKYSVHEVKEADGKKFWFYTTYVQNAETKEYAVERTGKYPYTFGGKS